MHWDRNSFYCCWFKEKTLYKSPLPPKVAIPPPLTIISVSEVATAGGADTMATHISRPFSHTQEWTQRPSIGHSRSAPLTVQSLQHWRGGRTVIIQGFGYKVVKLLFWDTPTAALMAFQSCILWGAQPERHIHTVWKSNRIKLTLFLGFCLRGGTSDTCRL